jgi:anti-sigma regulatory factor (Ser/Thr protein kinase)
VLDLTFDPEVLITLRQEVRVCAVKSGFSEGRARDIVLAIHELAANAIVHGGGAGRLRVWKLARTLQCRIDDGDLMRSLEEEAGRTGMEGIQPSSTSSPGSVNSLPSEPGHGLSVVRQLADHVQSLSGPHGTSVMITFGLSR